MEHKPYQIMVFGKPGCPKCKVLNQRIDKLLDKEEYAEFDKVYRDVETEDGLVDFCTMECVNPQRIPAMVVTRRDEQNGTYTPVPRRAPKSEEEAANRARLYTYVGLQTDYSNNGIISPKMIRNTLAEAQATA